MRPINRREFVELSAAAGAGLAAASSNKRGRDRQKGIRSCRKDRR